MPYTQQSTHTYYSCGYPNHLAKDCTAQGNPPQRGAQVPFNQNKKKTTNAAQDSTAFFST